MRRLAHLFAGLVVAVGPTAGLLSFAGTTAATVATVAAPTAAHADDYNCDDSYMPCDGSNADYLDGEQPYPYDDITPYWTDPIYDQSLGDPGEDLGYTPPADTWDPLGDDPFWQ